jgi:integrase
MNSEHKQLRGVYEKMPGSGEWWIRYADANGKIRREKAGTKSSATKLYQKRKTGVLEGQKLPEQLRAKRVTFTELAGDAIEWAKAHKLTWRDDEIRLKPLLEVFGDRPAESITPQEIERWFSLKGTPRKRDGKPSGVQWRPATVNRYKALVSMVYRQGIKNRKVSVNPAKEIERRTENNSRDRYLLPKEEAALRQTILESWPEHLPEVEVALNTGMRRGEQFKCDWSWVDLDKHVVTVPRSKHGEKRRVYLNDDAVAAFRLLWRYSEGVGRVFAHLYDSAKSIGARNWFKTALERAGIANFRWHDHRHTFASRLVMAGVDIRTVQELMGHKTIQVTMRYAHLAPEHQLEAVQRLCNTGSAVSKATDTRTDTSVLAVSVGAAQGQAKRLTCNEIALNARMAKLADAADLKSVGLQWLWGFKSPSGHQQNQAFSIR